MTDRHTPGPWILYADLPSAEPNWHVITNASRMRVLANVHIEPGNEADMANARLLRAAPELLDALADMLAGWRYIREQYGDLYGVGWDRAQQKAEAVLAKVRGEHR